MAEEEYRTNTGAFAPLERFGDESGATGSQTIYARTEPELAGITISIKNLIRPDGIARNGIALSPDFQRYNRGHEILLSWDFDSLGYVCSECGLHRTSSEGAGAVVRRCAGTGET